MNAVLDQEHREVGRIDGAHRDQRAHMHQQRTVALDRDHRPLRLRHRKTKRERQRKREALETRISAMRKEIEAEDVELGNLIKQEHVREWV